MWIERNLRFDKWLILSTVCLLGIGVVMIYSTSSISAERVLKIKSTYFLERQLVFAAIGMAVMLAVMHVNHEKLRRLAWPLLGLCMFLLLLVLIPGIGTEVRGGRRWIRFFGYGIQPSETARIALVIYLAHSLEKKKESMRGFKLGVLPYLIVSGILMLLILLERDLGGAVTIGIIMMIMLFVAGARFWHLAAVAGASVPAVFYFLISTEYRWDRLLATVNPWKYWRDEGWHLVQSILAFGSGGLTGVGLGEGRQKLLYLPDAHTDFILAAIGEELGFVGVMAVLGLFVAIVVRGSMVSFRASSLYGAYLAFGITAMIAAPAIINMMVVMGLLPTKGLVLPFVSHGGSALIMNMAAMGVLLNVSAKMYRTRT